MMLGMYIVQQVVVASKKHDIGALRTPWGKVLLFAKLASHSFFADPLGAGHIPRVPGALEQSRCSMLLGLGSLPEVRETRSSPILVTDFI